MKSPKAYYIEWQDAMANEGWLEDPVGWAKEEDSFVRQIGWILEENDKFMVLAGRNNPSNHGDEYQWGSVLKIPKTWIRARKRVTWE